MRRKLKVVISFLLIIFDFVSGETCTNEQQKSGFCKRLDSCTSVLNDLKLHGNPPSPSSCAGDNDVCCIDNTSQLKIHEKSKLKAIFFSNNSKTVSYP